MSYSLVVVYRSYESRNKKQYTSLCMNKTNDYTARQLHKSSAGCSVPNIKGDHEHRNKPSGVQQVGKIEEDNNPEPIGTKTTVVTG